MSPADPDSAQQERDEALLGAFTRTRVLDDAPVDPADEALLGMLTAWRADLGEDVPEVEWEPLRDPAPPRRRFTRRFRPARLLAGLAVAVFVVAGGTAVAAASSAGPDSPLWPVTRLVYPDHAESALAENRVEDLLTEARQAADEGRDEDAVRLLEEAEPLLADVADDSARERLRAEIDAVRDGLADLTEEPTPDTTGDAPGSEGHDKGEDGTRGEDRDEKGEDPPGDGKGKGDGKKDEGPGADPPNADPDVPSASLDVVVPDLPNIL